MLAGSCAALTLLSVVYHAIWVVPRAQGIPVREGLQALHRIVRYKTIRDFSIFAVFLMLYAFVTLNVIDVHQAWSTDAAVEDLFLDEEFGPVRHSVAARVAGCCVALLRGGARVTGCCPVRGGMVVLRG